MAQNFQENVWSQYKCKAYKQYMYSIISIELCWNVTLCAPTSRNYPAAFFNKQLTIDLMHMTSQKGAPARWGSNEALSRAPSPNMQPAGQPLHAIPPGRRGPAHWPRGWERQRSSSTTRARSATSLDPQHGVVVMETWHQCIRSIGREIMISFLWNSIAVVCSW